MSDHATIEQAAAAYRQSIDTLLDTASAMDRELRQVKARHAEAMRRAANRAAQDGAALERVIDQSRELFQPPAKRTYTVHGIKVGVTTGKASIEIPNQAKTIARIEEKLPAEQADELIETTRKVRKTALGKLGAKLLARLGVKVKPAEDTVVVRPAESDGLKMAQELLASAEAVQDAQQSQDPSTGSGQAGEAA